MNAAMNTSSQHDFHPDAESLSAFAEQALGERERGQVLAHLAVCARCRQVVRLAQEAANAERVALAAPRPATQPDAWWRRWRLVWVPAAVAASIAVASVSVYMRQSEQKTRTTEIAEQTAVSNEPAASNLPNAQAQLEHAKAAPMPAAREAARPTEQNAKREAAGATPNPSSHDIVATDAMSSQLGTMNRAAIERNEAATTSGTVKQGFVGGESTTEAYMPEASQTAWQQEQKQKKAAAATPRPMHAAQPAAPQSAGGADIDAAGSNTKQAAVSSGRLQTQEPPAARIAAQKQLQPAAIGAGAMKAVHLPSGLAAVSVAAAGHRTLAIDKAGTLFLSIDEGVHWEMVTRQWTGRLLLARTEIVNNTFAAPSAESQEGSSSGAGAAASPVTSFEILNDENQAWVSTDGETWVAQ